MKYFREDLHRRLSSPDFKKQVDGLEMLQKVFGYFFHHCKLLFEHINVLLNLTFIFFPGPSIHWEGNC